MKTLNRLVNLSVLVMVLISIAMPSIQVEGATPSVASSAINENVPQQALADESWALYSDPIYGYSVQMPSSWYVYPANGELGSLTLFSKYDRTLVPQPIDALEVQVGMAFYDKPANVSLQDWVAIPIEMAGRISVDASRERVISSDLVIESYITSEGNIRRAYVARDQKVYILDLIPDSAENHALFQAMVQSFTFTFPYYQSQPVRGRLFGGYSIFLPAIKSANTNLSSIQVNSGTIELLNVPTNYRLPFVGETEITQGPGCWTTHQGNDFEALDFSLSSGTNVYASEAGKLSYSPNNGGYGNVIKIQHADGRISWYAHVKKYIAPEGDVKKGELIALSGGAKTDPGHGTSTGAHLHFMVQAAKTRATEWIRDLPTITWYTKDINNPCMPPGQNDGKAVGQALDDPQPPSVCGAPALVQPAEGTVTSNDRVTFQWGAISCASHGYQLRISTNRDINSGDIVTDSAGISGNTFTMTIGSQWFNRDLYWSVKAANVANANWAPAVKFRVETAPPTSCSGPTLYSPSENHVFSSNTVSFRWADLACPHSGYQIWVKTAPYSNSGTTVAQTNSGTNQITLTIDSKWNNQDLFWSVRASGDPMGLWAPFRSFRIAPPPQQPAPSAPSLISPSNGVSYPQSTDFTLSWNSVSGASQYKVEVWGGAYSLMTLCDWQATTTCHAGTMWPGTVSWHVRARNSAGLESGWSDTWSFTIQQTNNSASVPTLSSPSNAAALAAGTDVTLSWNASTNAAEYTVEVWGGPYSRLTACNWQSGLSCHIGTMWPGTMSWHVKARNTAGQESGWSDAWTFTVQDSPQGPTKPVLANPSNNATLYATSDVTLSWNSVSNANQYKVELWGGPYSLMTPCDWQSGTSCHIGTMWTGTMYWHAKARNSAGQEGDWSDTWTFNIQSTPAGPSAPTLSSPGNGASLSYNTDVTLNWNTSSNATQYKVEVWGGPYSLMTSCDWQAGTSCHIGTMWPGTMSWHVKARNAASQESDWSATWSFTVQQQPGPSKPTLSNPGNGASLAYNTDVTLSWNSASNATQYKVELWGGPYSLMTPCDWQSGTSCHIGTMWPGTMSWHVQARNGSGQESDWSDTWSFTVQQQPGPSKPTLSNPGNGSSLANNTDVTLSWNSASNATQYKVELWGGPYSLMTPCDWQSGTSCHIGTMWAGTMSWHVKAKNGSGQESDWSDTWNFTIQQPPVTWKPSLSSPGNGALLAKNTDVTLTWNSLSGATQYKVELWGGPYSLMTPCNWQSGTSCHIGGMWPGNMMWHVKARDASGKESDWSDDWNFTIMN